MPPKKKAGGSKKKNGGGGSNNNGLGLSPEDTIVHLQCQVEALQLQLSARSEAASKASCSRDEMQKKVSEITSKHNEDKEMALAVTRDMTRQYKAMQEQLLDKINTRDNTIHNLRDQIERMKKTHEKQLSDKDETINGEKAHIKALEAKMEAQCGDFAELLRKFNEDLAAHHSGSNVVAVTRDFDEELRLSYDKSKHQWGPVVNQSTA